MRRRSRITRALKWSGAVLCIVTLMAWSISVSLCPFLLWGGRLETGGYWWIALEDGAFACHSLPSVAPGPFGRGPTWQVPLWLILLIVSLPTMIVFLLDRRPRFPSGCCQKCGYNLRGNVSGQCPKCGTERPAGIDAVCEDCGNISRFPLQAAGTVQRCDHCRKHVDVPSEPQGPC